MFCKTCIWPDSPISRRDTGHYYRLTFLYSEPAIFWDDGDEYEYEYEYEYGKIWYAESVKGEA